MHVAVIGAGLLGTCTAWFLRDKGIDVTVLDRREGAGLETSFGNGGYCQSGYPEPWNQPGIHRMFMPAWKATWGTPPLHAAMLIRTRALPGLAAWGLRFLRQSRDDRFQASLIANRRLAAFSQDTLRTLVQSTGIECHLLDRGTLWIYRDQASMDQLVRQLESMAEDAPRFSVLSAGEVTRIEPTLGPIEDRLKGGVRFDGELSANPYLFCRGLAALAAEAGVTFLFNHRVRTLTPLSKTVKIETDRGQFSADKVVIAAGSFSPQLARSLGVRLPIQPAKGYSLSIPMATWPARPDHMICDMNLHAGTNPMGNVLRVAGTAEFAGFDNTIPQDRTDSLLKLTREIFPDLASHLDAELCQPWTGLRPLSADGVPFIGESGADNILLNTGHGGLGWTQSAGSGKALADLMAGGRSELNLEAYAPARWTR